MYSLSLLDVGALLPCSTCCFQEKARVMACEDGKYRCSVCRASYSHRSNCRRHIVNIHLCPMQHVCPICKRAFSYSDNLKSHVRAHVMEASRINENL